MSYETSSEFQIRYLLKSVAVYLLFMRRIASISMLAVVSALSASAATVLFDFNSSLLPETPAKTVSVTDSGSGFVATLATASSSANLGSASSAASGDWVSSGTSFDTQGLDSFMENQISFGNSWQTFISGPKGSSLSLTISGLVAGASYQIALVTGCPFEGAGAWNSLVTSNTYGSADPSIGANSQTIQARTPTGYTISDVIANEDGEIILTVNTPGSAHTPTFNALAISGETASVPEPATASLSLLGLVALMARRRRAWESLFRQLKMLLPARFCLAGNFL